MKKILVCASRVSHILNFHLPYISYFKSMGYEADIAAEGVTDNPLIDRCFDITFTKNLLSADHFRTIAALKKIVKNGSYDMICSNSTLAGAALRTAVMSMGSSKPYFVHISHGYMFSEHGGMKSRMYLTAERLTKSPVDCLAVMNREDYDLAKKYRLAGDIRFIHGMGIDAARFPAILPEERAAVRKKFGADDQTTVLLCVGEFSARKNQTELIEVLNLLAPRHRQLRLVFAGEGKTLDTCKALVQKYELQTAVRFAGQIRNVNALYRSSDLLLSASKMEGLPFNVMEALHCGLPVIASDIKGHRDLITDGRNGLLFDGGREAIADAVERLLDADFYQTVQQSTCLDRQYYLENVRHEVLSVLDPAYHVPATISYKEDAHQ